MKSSTAIAPFVFNPVELPLKGRDGELYLREVERSVLDVHHESLAFWQMDPSTALLAVVEAFDSFALVQRALVQHGAAIGVWQYAKMYQDGFVYALRWLFARHPHIVLPSRVSEANIDDAGAFLNYAARYAEVAVFHIGLGKGLYIAEAASDLKVIRFIKAEHPNTRSHLYFGDLIAPQQDSMARGAPSEALGVLDVAVALGKVSLEHGRIAPESVRRLVRDELRAFHIRDFERDIVPLDGSASVGNGTYSDFQRYWANLAAWSTCALRSYLTLSHGGTAQSECMPTQLLKRSDFIDRMSHMCNLSTAAVDYITTLLTFQPQMTRPDPFLQPFFVDGTHLAWSPSVVCLSRQPRNLLKLLCRSASTRNLGATLNGSRERTLLRLFGERLQSRAGYSYKLNIAMRHQDSETELDLLAYRAAAPSEVLLVQAKTPIAADDLHEVDAMSEDLTAGVGQCQTAEAFLRAMPEQQRRDLYPFVDWRRVNSFHGLVITPDSEPGSRFESDAIPAISLSTFAHRLRPRDMKSPSRIVAVCRDRPWLDDRQDEVLAFSRTEIGGIHYELPVFMTLNAAADIQAEMEARAIKSATARDSNDRQIVAEKKQRVPQ